MSRPPFGLLLTVAASLAATGCSSAIRYPKLVGPGTAWYQRANAEAFDPYPLPDLGPPIDGGRPREFGIPRSEVERAQDYSIVQAARRGQRPGPPTTAIAAPPMVASPPPAFTPPQHGSGVCADGSDHPGGSRLHAASPRRHADHAGDAERPLRTAVDSVLSITPCSILQAPASPGGSTTWDDAYRYGDRPPGGARG
jgi:hypothetical protein